MLSTILKKIFKIEYLEIRVFMADQLCILQQKAKQKNDSSAHTNWHRASLDYRSLYEKRNKERDTDQAMHCVFMSWHITVYAENCSLKENRVNKEQKSPFTASSLVAMRYVHWMMTLTLCFHKLTDILQCMLKIVL